MPSSTRISATSLRGRGGRGSRQKQAGAGGRQRRRGRNRPVCQERRRGPRHPDAPILVHAWAPSGLCQCSCFQQRPRGSPTA
eukprot:8070452-Pyramimonas_sp.AAC.1